MFTLAYTDTAFFDPQFVTPNSFPLGKSPRPPAQHPAKNRLNRTSCFGAWEGTARYRTQYVEKMHFFLFGIAQTSPSR